MSNFNKLISDLTTQNISMVTRERFETILRNSNTINNIDGDVIECGVWKGGMSIFLSYLFPTKEIWISDSFDGFQPLDIANYYYEGETHTPSYNPMIKASIELVKNNFTNFNLNPEDPRIHFLPGFVKDTLPSAPLTKISLLRIDVDAYSATREVLDYLYDKVSHGGFIVFDDSCLTPTVDAFCDFFESKGIDFKLKHPITDEIISNPRQYNLPCGCYVIKGE